MGEPRRDERLDVRLSAEHKDLIAKAAAITGQPLSSFAVATLVRRARRVLAEHETTALSARDRDAFLATLDDDRPNDALRAAVDTYLGRRG